MMRYSIEPRTRKKFKGYGSLSFATILSNKYGEQLLDTSTKAGINVLKTTSKKLIPKAAEAWGEFLGNKIADKIVKLAENSKNVEEIIIPPEKRENINRIKTSIIKIEYYKISKLLKVSLVSKFVTRKWIKVNDLSSGQYSVNKSIRFKILMLRWDLCD